MTCWAHILFDIHTNISACLTELHLLVDCIVPMDQENQSLISWIKMVLALKSVRAHNSHQVSQKKRKKQNIHQLFASSFEVISLNSDIIYLARPIRRPLGRPCQSQNSPPDGTSGGRQAGRQQWAWSFCGLSPGKQRHTSVTPVQLTYISVHDGPSDLPSEEVKTLLIHTAQRHWCMCSTCNTSVQTPAHIHKYTSRQTEKSYRESTWDALLTQSVYFTEKNCFRRLACFFHMCTVLSHLV